MRNFFWLWIGFCLGLLICWVLFINVPEIKRPARCFDEFAVYSKHRLSRKDLIYLLEYLDAQCERHVMSGCAYIAYQNEFDSFDFGCKSSYL